MADVTLRLVKGSPLTYQEVDDNFNNLNDSTGHFKNRLINGNFDFWQRETSFAYTSPEIYAADRWVFFNGADSAGTISRQAFTLGQTDVPGEPQFFLRNTRSTAATGGNWSIAQRVESVRTFAGQTCTWSFWAKVSSGTKVFTPRARQRFGTGGSPSPGVDTSASDITLTTSWQKFSITFALPSISGKTLGTNRNDHLQFDLGELASFSTFTADFAQSQLEKGSQATEFEFRPLGTELALCQRYYFKTYNIDTAPGTNTTSGSMVQRARGTEASNSIIFNLFLPVSMRVAGTNTVISTVTGTPARIRDETTSTDLTATFSRSSTNHATINNTTNTTLGNLYSCHATLDAEL